MDTSTDRIERSILIRAPRERVWQALSDAEEFGRWFGVDLSGQRFELGQTARGRILSPGYDHLWLELVVQRMQPQQLFAYHWHPHAVEAEVDYSQEPPTLVTFTLEERPESATWLTVVESGFERIPAERRAHALRMNEQGWEGQLDNIKQHLDG